MEDNIKQLFTITIFGEHSIGLLNQVLIIFTRRCLNIEDVSGSRTAIEDIHKITITLWSDRSTMEKVVKQIEKRVDVLRAFLYTDDDIIYQEIALYKVDTDKLLKEQYLESLIRHHNARILDITPDYTVIEKAGQPWETESLLAELRQYGVRQFVRSGRVCVTKSAEEHLDQFIAEQMLRRESLKSAEQND